ncbi:RES family NAD+ phosphorylase [Indioceanicola profundi]|uniref:RES family NAD+ phosphorylase n=1 Tax=Indioceanicola profundi TaxID=2220096 RepID=UPI001CED455C|nr:RES family NAD+ phosphorylase [Indioceanicola profundi]
MLRVWRISGGGHPVFAGEGARLFGGRWNSPGRSVIYCGSSFAICMLERLVWSGIGRVPKGDLYVTVDIPDELVEHLDETKLPEWQEKDSEMARQFGDQWLDEARAAALSVPSAVTELDRNIIINPRHPDFGRITPSAERPVAWDSRLLGRKPAD